MGYTMKTVLNFTNTLGESVTFNKTGSFLYANKIEGLGDVVNTIQTQKAPYQDGYTLIDSVLEGRVISFEIYIQGVNDTDISGKRSNLAKVLNPKLGEGLLQITYGSVVRVINAVAEHVPTYPSGKENRGKTHQIGLVNLYCPNPFLRSSAITEEPTFEPLFQFPFEGAFEMGIQRDQRIIVNDGDSPAPLQIEFYGPAVNPIITNNTTAEYIKINQELFEDEFMRVDTTPGNKSVFFVSPDGTERNVFNWIDLNSTFFQLDIGENDIQYSADSDIQGAIVNISYSKLYNAV
jgi:hypothetical protein